jgi:hypothetical protein
MESPSVGMLITANPSTLLEFARRANLQRESLMRDIFDGTLSSDLDVPPEVRQALQPRVSRPNRARVRELQAIVKRTGTLYPKDFWPQVSVLAVWMGGSVGVYLPQLEEYYGRPALRDHGLSASEGRMTIPLEDGTSTGVLDYLHHYYEFVPEDEIEASQPTVLAAHELKEGRNYFILLTTSGGLYRYDIHDVVRCVGYEGQVPKLQFLNKGAHFSSLTGEKLSEFQVVSAVRAAFRELGLPLETFTLAPVMSGGRPGYVLLLEPSRQERDNARLARCVERQLQGENCEYGEKLESGRLNALAVREVPRGAWARFQQQRVAQRGNLEEFKHPCLVSDLQFAERLSAPPPDVLPPGTGPT